MKQLCKERNNLYEKQNELKGQKWKIEKLLERSEMWGVAVVMPYILWWKIEGKSDIIKTGEI